MSSCARCSVNGVTKHHWIEHLLMYAPIFNIVRTQSESLLLATSQFLVSDMFEKCSANWSLSSSHPCWLLVASVHVTSFFITTYHSYRCTFIWLTKSILRMRKKPVFIMKTGSCRMNQLRWWLADYCLRPIQFNESSDFEHITAPV